MSKTLVNKRFICVQACQLGGKRYEVGEPLVEGVEPNSHFKDTQTGQVVNLSTPVLAQEEASTNKSEGGNEIAKLMEEVKAEADKKLEAFKKLVGDHLAKFEKRLEALEKANGTAKKGGADTKAESAKDVSGDEKGNEIPKNEEKSPEGDGKKDASAPNAPKSN